MNVLVFFLSIFFFFFIIISFLDFMSRLAVIWISSPELSYVCHTYAIPTGCLKKTWTYFEIGIISLIFKESFPNFVWE